MTGCEEIADTSPRALPGVSRDKPAMLTCCRELREALKLEISGIYWISLFFVYFILQKEILQVAIIGQSLFAAEVYKNIKNNGHRIVGVFTIPDQGAKEDPLGFYLFYFSGRKK